MFNDKYGLTRAVLEVRKTQTRRLSTFTLHEGDLQSELTQVYPDEIFMCGGKWFFKYKGKVYHLPKENYPKFKVGEIVAIAQSYKNIGYQPTDKTTIIKGGKIEFIEFQEHKGWNNKMFVSCENMLHFIRITNVRIERLQDISDEDCLAEGIEYDGKAKQFYCGFNKSTNSKIWMGSAPREAYAALIDKVGKKGDWDKNPYVFVYDFKLNRFNKWKRL